MSEQEKNSNFFGPGPQSLGLVLSGGGVRAAYQAGVLCALSEQNSFETERLKTIVGTSIGAVNTVVISATLEKGLPYAAGLLSEIWRVRTYANTFTEHISVSFFKAIGIAIAQYLVPSTTNPTSAALFNPQELINRLHEIIYSHKGMKGKLSAAVMTTLEGKKRQGLLFTDAVNYISENDVPYGINYVNRLSMRHALASAALPWILPPVDIEDVHGKAKIRLIDGGFVDNIPVDPAIRLGGEDLLIVDISGRKWWNNFYEKPHYSPDPWKVPAEKGDMCLVPRSILTLECKKSFGSLVKQALGNSTREYVRALGPVWPIFRLLKHKLGEEVAYEMVSYILLQKDYLSLVIDMGYKEAMELFKT